MKTMLKPLPLIPKLSQLRWEISIALLIKLLLLIGLWWLLFRWQAKTEQPDIAARFELPTTISVQPVKESRDVR